MHYNIYFRNYPTALQALRKVCKSLSILEISLRRSFIAVFGHRLKSPVTHSSVKAFYDKINLRWFLDGFI